MPGLLTLITAVGKVGVSGLLDFFRKRQAMKEAEQEHRFELERMDRQAAIEERLGAMRLEGVQAESEAKVLSAAVQAEAQEGVARQRAYTAEAKGVSRWVLNLRAATRPGLTWLLSCAVVALVFITADAWALLLPLLVAGAELSWGFWFGSKMIEQARKK